MIAGESATRGKMVERSDPPFPSAFVSVLAGFDESQRPLVQVPGSAGGDPVPARQSCLLGVTDLGREVILTFENGDPMRPIIVGLLQSPGAVPAVRVSPDGERLEIAAEHEIILRCGKASITLTQAGKILIRGAYLLSRSSGANRIKGASVEIN